MPLFVGFEGTPGEANAWRQPGTARERVSEIERREEDLLGRAVFDRGIRWTAGGRSGVQDVTHGIERAVEEGCVRVKEDAHGQEWRAHSTRMERNDSCISRQIVRPPMRAWAYVSVHCICLEARMVIAVSKRHLLGRSMFPVDFCIATETFLGVVQGSFSMQANEHSLR